MENVFCVCRKAQKEVIIKRRLTSQIVPNIEEIAKEEYAEVVKMEVVGINNGKPELIKKMHMKGIK